MSSLFQLVLFSEGGHTVSTCLKERLPTPDWPFQNAQNASLISCCTAVAATCLSCDPKEMNSNAIGSDDLLVQEMQGMRNGMTPIKKKKKSLWVPQGGPKPGFLPTLPEHQQDKHYAFEGC